MWFGRITDWKPQPPERMMTGMLIWGSFPWVSFVSVVFGFRAHFGSSVFWFSLSFLSAMPCTPGLQQRSHPPLRPGSKNNWVYLLLATNPKSCKFPRFTLFGGCGGNLLPVFWTHMKNTSRGLEDSRGRWMRNQTQCTPLTTAASHNPQKLQIPEISLFGGLWREPSTCVLDAHEKNTSRGLEDSRGRWMRNQTQCNPLNHSCQPQTPKAANSRDLALRGLWREPSTCVLDAHEKLHLEA